MSPAAPAQRFALESLARHALELPLARPLVTGRGTYRRRRVVLLRAAVRCGQARAHGWGEVAPLPGWNDLALDELESLLTRLRADTGPEPIDSLDGRWPWLQSVPALRFGLECAVLDACARIAGRPLTALLGEDRSDRAGASVAVQFTLGDDDAEPIVAALRAARTRGFDCAKLKVGARAVADDLDRIRRIAAALGDGPGEMTLRLDANGAWTVDDALRALAALPTPPVTLVEQPVVDADLDALLTRYDRHGPALAADESCAVPGRARALVETGRLDALVVKPAALGGLLPALRLADHAHAHGVDVILSNLMESAVGRAAVAHLAAARPRLRGPHGLATGDWFARDVADDDEITAGRLALRNGPGIGFEPALR
jgi:o-succinylbenzoate synthase